MGISSRGLTYLRPGLLAVLLVCVQILAPSAAHALVITHTSAPGAVYLPPPGVAGIVSQDIFINTQAASQVHVSPSSAGATGISYSEQTPRNGMGVSLAGINATFSIPAGWVQSPVGGPFYVYFDPDSPGGVANDLYFISDNDPPWIAFPGSSTGFSSGSGLTSPNIASTAHTVTWSMPSAIETQVLAEVDAMGATSGIASASYRILQRDLAGGRCTGAPVQIGANVNMLAATALDPMVAATHAHCYSVEVTATDRVGNTAVVESPDTEAVDTTPPVVTVTPDGDPLIRNTFSIDASLTATDPESGSSGSLVVEARWLSASLRHNICGPFSPVMGFTSFTPTVFVSPSHTPMRWDTESGECYQVNLAVYNSAAGTHTSLTDVLGTIKVDREVPAAGVITYNSPEYQNTTSISALISNSGEELTDYAVRDITIEKGSLVDGSCIWTPATFAVQPAHDGANTVGGFVHAGCYRLGLNSKDLAGNADTVNPSTNLDDEIRVDTQAPAGGAIDYSNGPNDTDQYQISHVVNIRLTLGSDHESTVAERHMEREVGTLDEGACTWSGVWDLSPLLIDSAAATQVLVDSTLEHAHCYRWRMIETDKAGNVATSVQGRFIGIDDQAPEIDLDIRDYDNAEHAYFIAAPDLIYYRPTGSDNFYVHIESHAASGTQFARFPIFTQLSPLWTKGGGEEGQHPLQTLYSWTPGAPQPVGPQTVLVQGNSGKQASLDFRVLADYESPHDGTISYDGREQATTSVVIHTSLGSDDASGMGATRILRSEGIYEAGACRDFAPMQTRITNAPDTWVDTTLLAGHCYQYLYAERDRVGNEIVYLPSAGSVVKVDGMAPVASSVTYTAGSVSSWVPGSSAGTLFYNPTLAGSFTAHVNSSSVFSAVTAVTFPDLGPGWCCSRTFGASAADNTYSFAALAPMPASASVTITARSGATGSVPMGAIIPDDTAPVGGSVAHLTGSQASRFIELRITRGSDAISGIDRRELYRQKAPLRAGRCGTWGAWTLAAKDPDLTIKDLVSTDDSCYRYKLVQFDHVGNSLTVLSPDVTRVNADAPTTGEARIDSLTPTQYRVQPAKIFYNSHYSGAMLVHIDTDPSVRSVTFTNPGRGWKISVGTDNHWPFSSRYSYTDKAAAPGRVSARITDKNGRITNVTYDFVADAAAPAGASVTYSSGVTSHANLRVARTLARDIGSGIRSQVLQVQTATAPLCSAPSSWTTLSNPPVNFTASLDPGTCYRYRILAYDMVGNVSAPTGAFVLLDQTPPIITAGQISAGTELYQHVASSTELYYNPDVAGTVMFSVTASDLESGMAGVSVEGLPHLWRVRSSQARAYPPAVYYSISVSYPAGAALPSGPLRVAVRNKAGLMARFAFTVLPDSVPPAAGATISYVNGLSPTLAPRVDFTRGPGDALTGISRVQIQRSTAEYSRSRGCATYSAFTVVASRPVSPWSDMRMTSSTCARYRLVEYDGVSNARITSSTHRVIRDDDTSPPTTFTVRLTATSACTDTPVAADGVAKVTWAAATDNQSGIAGYDIYVDGSRRATLAASARTWTASGLGSGLHNIAVAARNGDGLIRWGSRGRASSSMALLVDLAPPTLTTAGPSGGLPALPTTFQISATDDTCVSSTDIYIDGQFTLRLGAGAANPKLSVAEGPHTWYAVTTDAVGRSVRSADTAFAIEAGATISAHFENAHTAASPDIGVRMSDDTHLVVRAAAGAPAGSFDIVADAAAASGIAQIDFPVIGGTTRMLISGGRMRYSFTSSGFYVNPRSILTVVAHSALGSLASASVTLTTDDAGPVDAAISYSNHYQQPPNIQIALARGVDELSPIARTRIEMSTADLDPIALTCGAFSDFAPFVETQITDTSYTHTSAQMNRCYHYRYVVSDSMGNETTVSSAATVRVGAPQAPQMTIAASTSNVSGGFYYDASSATAYYQPLTTTTIIANLAATEPLQGVASATTSSLPRFGTPRTIASGAQWAFYYTLTAPGKLDTTPDDVTLTATSGSGASTSRTLHIHPDIAAPVDGGLDYSTGALLSASNTISWANGHDDDSGVAIRQLQRQQIPLTAFGCAEFGTSWTALATNPVGTYTDTDIAVNTCYRYRYLEQDRVGNVLYDTEDNLAPAYLPSGIPSASLRVTAGAATGARIIPSASGTLVYLRPSAGAKIDVEAVPDPASSVTISSVQFPDLGTSLTGATTVLTSPWKTTYKMDAASTSVVQSPRLVTVRAAGGGSMTIGLRVVLDVDSPVGTTINYTANVQSSGSVAVTAIAGIDAGSGMAPTGSWTVERQSADFANGACAGEGAWASAASSAAFTDSTLQHGHCYRYRIVSTDMVGNTSMAMGGWVRIDQTAPVVSQTTLTQAVGSEVYTNIAADTATVYVNADQAGSFVATAHASDPESGVRRITWPALGSGWSSPAEGSSIAYAFTSEAVQPNIDPAPLATVINGAGLTQTVAVGNVYLDGVDPVGGSIDVLPSLAAGYPQADVVLASDLDSGVATHEIWRQEADLSAGGVCGAFSSWQLLQEVSASGHIVDSSAQEEHCYQYRYEAADHVGRKIVREDASEIVKVPLGVQVQPKLTISSICSSCIHLESGIWYYKVSLGLTMDMTVDSDPSITSVDFPSIGTCTPVTVDYSPYTRRCPLTSDVTGNYDVTVHRGSATNVIAFQLARDATGPSWPSGAVSVFQTPSGVQIAVTAQASDAGSGMLIYSYRRRVSAIYDATTGTCTTPISGSMESLSDQFLPSTGYLDTTATHGRCYTYIIFANDWVGNFSSYLITDVKVA